MVVVFNLFQNFICAPAPYSPDQYGGSDMCKLLLAVMNIFIIGMILATVTYGRRLLLDIENYEKELSTYGIYIKEYKASSR
jgi:hypothetical protein